MIFNKILKSGASANLIKDTRKIFDTLLTTSSSAACANNQQLIDIYSLSVDYVLLELGCFYKQFDVMSTSLHHHEVTAQLATTNIQEGFYDLKNFKLRNKTDKVTASLKSKLTELLVRNCLNKKEQQNKPKSTFKIGKFTKQDI